MISPVTREALRKQLTKNKARINRLREKIQRDEREVEALESENESIDKDMGKEE